jgi:Domain of unknown function (DUF4340)
MNVKTTLVLLILVAAGAGLTLLGPSATGWLHLSATPTSAADAGTLAVLKTELRPDKLTHIEVTHGDQHVVLDRRPAAEWTLPGHWPARQPEVDGLVHLLSNLESRFAPRPLDESADLSTLGLAQPAVTIKVQADGASHTLQFGEDRAIHDSFARATYLRLDDKPEVVRLAPGLIALLARPADYYQQRRLFPSERVAKDSESTERVERLAAQSIFMEGPLGSGELRPMQEPPPAQGGRKVRYALARRGDDWQLTEPVTDRADPEKLKTILAAVPDIWAEQFVEKPKKDLAEYGLAKPEQTIRIGRSSGDTITLLVGKQSQVKTRTVMRPAPNMGGPPMPPQKEIVHDEYRYAKLQNNDQIFEIKADKLKDLFVAVDTLRDAQLARFRTDDARRVEIQQSGTTIELAKDKDQWRMQKPFAADAESSKITELLDKLTGLQARDKDVVDKADGKSYGLDKPAATLRVTVEETAGSGDSRRANEGTTKKTRTVTFLIGKRDAGKSKLYVRMDGRERINAVEDGVWKLVERPALAYRGRRVLDWASTDLAKIEVQRGNEAFTLEQDKGTWRLAAPVRADVDSFKVGQLAGDLGQLEAVEYISASASADALETQFGLGKPALRAKLVATDASKPAKTLLVGKQQPGKTDYYAKLASGPEIFVLRKEIHDTLNQDSLAYRPAQLWQLSGDDIQEVRIQKDEPEYRLKRDDSSWRVAGPFEAPAVGDQVRPLTDELANVRCERYVAHTTKNLVAYGLDKPYLRVVVEEKSKPADPKNKTTPTPPAKVRTLAIGKPTDKEPKSRFAKLADSDAVFVLGEKLVTALDHGALDWLSRDLLALDARSIERIQARGAGGPLTLRRQGDEWRVTESPAAPFPADSESIASALGVWANLRARRLVAYGAKSDLTRYGLDRPSTIVSVTLRPSNANGKSAASVEHTLALGKPVDGSNGERYVRLDNGPAIAVLDATAVADLTHGYLDYVNRSVLKFDPARLQRIERHSGSAVLEIGRQGEGWQLSKPANVAGDAPSLDALIAELAALRAKRVAAYPAGDLKAFGLEHPAATVKLYIKSADGKPSEHTLKIGNPVNTDRYVQVDQSNAVCVLPGALTTKLLASPIHFRDRNLARFTDIDRVRVERGVRKVTFAKIAGSWKVTQPLEADAEQSDLDDFVNAVAHLRADDLVADRPGALKAYGLDRPEARWHFYAGDKELLDLVVGNAEPSSGRRYVKLANRDLVFLVDLPLTTKLLGEYRNRTVWPTSLDASQIERLSYAGTHPFVLEKVDTEWRVAGKPDVKVTPEAIRETLDALAGLRAARYVADTSGDMKLYGLDPAQVVLDIQTPSGKRTLHIGRPEGESRRLYASVPETGHGAVFVLAETDAQRIARSLSDFTRPIARPVTPAH